jgi:RNA polymerase primary sigma factor
LPSSEQIDNSTGLLPSVNANANPIVSAVDGIERRQLDTSGGSKESLLTRYFRDMAAHPVMTADEELECAQALERAELELWSALLAFVPLAEPILAYLMREVNEINEAERPDVPQIQELQNLIATYRKHRSKLNTGQLQRWNELSETLARCIRSCDPERQWLTHALVSSERGGGASRAGSGTSTTVRTPAYLLYIARVRQAELQRLEAKNRFVRANLRLVVSVARRHNHGRLPLDDLIQEGNVGLIKAIDRFDYARGYRFSTYATWWIRHSIGRAIADKGRAVRVPVHMLDIIKCIAVATTSILARTGREPTLEELAKDTGISRQRLTQARECAGATTVSLDRPIGDDDGRTFLDLLADKGTLSPFDSMAKQNWVSEVQHLLGTLTPIETRIIRWRFGLDDDVELTLKEIGDKYGLSRERIRQLQEQALRKMRKQVSSNWL